MKPLDLLLEMSSHTNSAGSWSADFEIAIGPSDSMAAQILLWCVEKYPKLETGDLSKALDAAKWWLVLFAAMEKAQKSNSANTENKAEQP